MAVTLLSLVSSSNKQEIKQGHGAAGMTTK